VISTYLDLINMAFEGKIDELVVVTSKWSRARETVLAQ
jgi:hypothetical protein